MLVKMITVVRQRQQTVNCADMIFLILKHHSWIGVSNCGKHNFAAVCKKCSSQHSFCVQSVKPVDDRKVCMVFFFLVAASFFLIVPNEERAYAAA